MKLFIFSIFIFVFLLLSLLFFFHISRTTFAINGCFCSSSSSCYPDGCTRKTLKTDGTIEHDLCKTAGCNGAYNACYDTSSTVVSQYFCLQQPPCCKDMVENNNAFACCWPERGFCHPYLFCSKLDSQQQCGWYWEYHDGASNSQQGYGCMKGSSPESLQPIYGLPPGVLQPTATPQPSLVPTRAPTLKPTQYLSPTRTPTTIPTSYVVSPTGYIFPTQYIPPTDIPVVYPTNYVLPSLTFPTININMEPLEIVMRNVIVQSEKILQIPTEVAKKITQLDVSLETLINQFIQNLIDMTYTTDAVVLSL